MYARHSGAVDNLDDRKLQQFGVRARGLSNARTKNRIAPRPRPLLQFSRSQIVPYFADAQFMYTPPPPHSSPSPSPLRNLYFSLESAYRRSRQRRTRRTVAWHDDTILVTWNRFNPAIDIASCSGNSYRSEITVLIDRNDRWSNIKALQCLCGMREHKIYFDNSEQNDICFSQLVYATTGDNAAESDHDFCRYLSRWKYEREA